MRASIWTALLLASGLACVADGASARVTTSSRRQPPAAHPAVGSLDDLAPELAAAFADDPRSFGPVRDLGPDDWLHTHTEPGQTVAQFLAKGPNSPTPERAKIYMQPIGELPSTRASSATLAEYVELFYGLEVEVLAPIEVESLHAHSREHELGRQLLTGDVLDALERLLPDDAFLLVGLTIEDLYPGDEWNFVFGYASFDRRVCVYSLLRFDPLIDDPRGSYGESVRAQLILERSLAIMTHELTHSFGMRHCIYYDCLMNGTNFLAELDAHPLHLCPVCLRKLHAATGLDPVARYERLGAFYAAHGMSEAQAWTQARVAAIAAAR